MSFPMVSIYLQSLFIIRTMITHSSELPISTGWRSATLYQLREDPTRVCLYFGGEEYEGLDSHYSFVDGVLKDGDGDVVELVGPVVHTITDSEVFDLKDSELDELEENEGDY